MMFKPQQGDYFKVADLTEEQYHDLRLLYSQQITDKATINISSDEMWNLAEWEYVGWDDENNWDCWSGSSMFCGRFLTHQQVFAEEKLESTDIPIGVKDTESTTRTNVLQKAIDIINGQRQEDYGDPSRNFKNVADGWSIIFGKKVEPYEVALAMDWLKTCRLLKDGDHTDSWIDKAGYTGLGAELALLKDSE